MFKCINHIKYNIIFLKLFLNHELKFKKIISYPKILDETFIMTTHIFKRLPYYQYNHHCKNKEVK